MWAGRYAVFDELASGGMASVFLACRLGPGESARVVAIKKLFESFAKQPGFVTMFLDEAHIAARIRHPNVVTTFEFLRIPDSLGIVMEFVLGASLLDLLEIAADRKKPAPLRVTTAILQDTLRGLHAAHEAKDEHGNPFGLVHRDVSPHNVLVGKDGVARVIDFGIAKAAGRLQVTEVGVMKGKYAYMAPEQIRAKEIDRRVDVYSSGIVLWEALTGQSLFGESTDPDLFSKRGQGLVTAPRPSTVNRKLPPGVDRIVARALAVSPDERFATTAEMADALAAEVPRAPAEDVAAWVVGLAGSRLLELEAKRNEVETSFASGELQGLGTAASVSTFTSPPESATRASSSPPELAPLDPALPTLELDLPPPVSRAPPSRSTAKPPVPPPASSKRPPSPPAQGSLDDAFDDAQASPLKLDLAVETSSQRPIMSSSLDARFGASSGAPSSMRPTRSRKARSSVRGWALPLLLLALGGGAAAIWGPPFLKAALVEAAGRRGLVLSVAGIEPKVGGLTLTGLTLSLASVPNLTVKAAEADLDLDVTGSVRRLRVRGYELTLHGDARDLATSFAAWQKAPHVPLSFEASAGHLLWTDMLVPGVQGEGLDVAIVAGAKTETSLQIDVPSLTFTVPRGSTGPWQARLESGAEETKVTLFLDRSKTDGPPTISLLARPTLGTVLTANIPRTKAVQIGLPAEFLRAGPDPELELFLEAQAMPTGEPISAHATLTLFRPPATILGTGGAPADIVFEGALAGDPSHALHIDPGSISVGKTKTRLLGTVAIEHDGIRFELDKPVGRALTAPPPWVIDTREWTTPEGAAPKEKPAAETPAAPSASAHPHK